MQVLGTVQDEIKKMARSMSASPAKGKKNAVPDMDILDKLKQEHDEVKALLKKMVDSKSGSARGSLLKQIKKAQVPHERAEEKAVYDPCIALRVKDAAIDGNEGYIEHSVGDEMVKFLSGIRNKMAPEFSAGAKVLKELITHHIDEEERNIWSLVRDNFSMDQREEMNRKFEAAKKRVKVS